MKKATFIVLGILAVCIGLYPILYFVADEKFGLLLSKSDQLLDDTIWNIGFYGHITLGGLALLIGWLQFSEKIRRYNMSIHRKIGIAYVLSVLISGICGLYIGIHASGGMISKTGFIALAVIWLTTTLLGFRAAKDGKIDKHEVYMIYSYAACFAAVTLRIWLPLLINLFDGEFIPAYRIVAWLCWVPNMFVAYFITRNG